MNYSSRNITLRAVFDILLLIGIFVMPFWILVTLAIVGLIYFKNFYEFIGVFMISDFLYAVPLERFSGSVFVLTITSVVVFVIINFTKNKMLLR
jgi:hypothetical protein